MKVTRLHYSWQRGAEVDSRDKWGATPLHASSLHERLEASRLLLDQGANVNARMRNNCTPMHLSAASGNLEIVKLLLEHVLAVTDEEQTPYQVALAFGHGEIAELLRERGGF
jgi:ankyrin repeat protein